MTDKDSNKQRVYHDLELIRFHNGLRTSQFFNKEEKSQGKCKNGFRTRKTFTSEKENGDE